MTVTIEFTDKFRSQVRSQVKYLTHEVGFVAAQRFIDHVLDRFEQRVGTFPSGCSRCAESDDLGFGQYYEFIDAKAQVRIIYRLIEGSDTHVSALLFVRTRQNLRDQLFKLVLMSP